MTSAVEVLAYKTAAQFVDNASSGGFDLKLRAADFARDKPVAAKIVRNKPITLPQTLHPAFARAGK